MFLRASRNYVILWLALEAIATPARAQMPSAVACAAVREVVREFGLKRAKELARQYLTPAQIRQARLCLKGATGRRRK